jgi:hypothetical protein
VIKKQVNELLNTLTSMLQVTRRGRMASDYSVQTSDMALRFERSPREGRPPKGVGLLYPPGTNPDIILGDIPDEYTVKARTVTEFAAGREVITHREAIAILDIIMERDGKRALGVCLAQASPLESLDAYIEKLDKLARQSLGESYYIARRDRTPHARKGASMGKAPKATGAAATTRWRVVWP